MKKIGFTLAEVLITLAIIGVVAAISIPSVVANTQQKEFQTGLRKAVSVLNSAITMNMALDGESPYENKSLYHYLARHMSIMKTMAMAPAESGLASSVRPNVSFYTTDGMRFEFPYSSYSDAMFLHENANVHLRGSRSSISGAVDYVKGNITHMDDNCSKTGTAASNKCSFCGSYGLNSNVDNTTTTPCLIVVDVNGDRKPFPKNASCFGYGDIACAKENVRKFGDPSGLHLTDTFSIMITDKQAIPYGQAAQKAMYQAQKSK